MSARAAIPPAGAGLGERRVPRLLHPGAWWIWAIGLATAAGRITNPLLLLLIAAVAGYVVVARRTDAPWARSYAAFVRLALAALVIRVVLQILFGAGQSGAVLVHLPAVPLPDWLAGLRLGGDVTTGGLLAAVYDGLRLAVLLACVGAANALASPARLLRILPAAVYEIGVAVTIALSFAPQAVASVGRVRAAHRLRGRSDRGPVALARLAVPVLHDALDRSLELAAAMDTRGFGRRAGVPRFERRVTGALTTVGLLAMTASSYGLLAADTSPALGLPLLAAGVLLAAGGLRLAGRRTSRTRYRPDPWGRAEWLVAGSGLVAAAGTVLAPVFGIGGLDPSTAPIAVPLLPLLPAAGVLAALLPATAAPPVPPSLRPRARAVGAA